jgi:peroxiredoxin
MGRSENTIVRMVANYGINYLKSMSLASLISTSPLTLLYFYPKDDTPGCTLEAQDFTRLVPDFAKLGIQIV